MPASVGDLPLVVSIVLNWNRKDDTLACLQSLAAQETPGWAHEMLLVDNGSTDGSPIAVERAYPSVEVIALCENLGFAAGINVGIAEALTRGADWTLLVNNDAVAEPGSLSGLLDAGSEPEIGMLAPTVVYADEPARVWPSAGTRRRSTLAAIDTTAAPPSSEPYDVEWATACCLLVRAAVWQDVGLFDERYRFYYEDHDLCLRARARNWRIVHVPAVRARHRVSASTGAGTLSNMYLLARSSVPFFVLHTSGLHRAVIVVYRLGSLVRTLVEAIVEGRPRSGWAYVVGLIHGVQDVLRSRQSNPRRSAS